MQWLCSNLISLVNTRVSTAHIRSFSYSRDVWVQMAFLIAEEESVPQSAGTPRTL
jgi:hypothetical protein